MVEVWGEDKHKRNGQDDDGASLLRPNRKPNKGLKNLLIGGGADAIAIDYDSAVVKE